MAAAIDPEGRASQLPHGRELFLDHVGHFVGDRHAASEALARAGFTPTPISAQVNPDPAGGPPTPTGTGNVCAMLERGYIEVLFASASDAHSTSAPPETAQTPLGRELEAARARHDGLHLAAFAVADTALWHAELATAGFRPQPVVDMRRPVETAAGPGIAAFSVVRLEPGQMPEGRIQMLRHHTEAEVWQPRWLAHPNTAIGLDGLTIAVADVPDATRRFARFFGRTSTSTSTGERFDLDRGWVELIGAQAPRPRWPDLPIPSPPFMAVCEIAVRSLAAVQAALAEGGLAYRRLGDRVEAHFPPPLGHGLWVFKEDRKS